MANILNAALLRLCVNRSQVVDKTVQLYESLGVNPILRCISDQLIVRA